MFQRGTTEIKNHIREIYMHALMRTVKKVCGIINAIAALHIGLSTMGYNVFNYPMVADNIGGAMTYINYAFGVSGALFLVLCAICCYSCSSCCSAQGCASCGVMGRN
jgi:hypothetical protein